jgi:hypothetical protein
VSVKWDFFIHWIPEFINLWARAFLCSYSKIGVKILTITTKLAGVSFGDCQRNIKFLGNPGINEFDVNWEPENPHDPNAISVEFGEYKLGYLPRSIAQKISPLIKAGKQFVAEFVSVNQNPFHERVGMTVKIIEINN